MTARFLLLCCLLFAGSASVLPQPEVTPPPPTIETPEHRAALETCIRAIPSQSDPAELATFSRL